jgi:hypothetical protein
MAIINNYWLSPEWEIQLRAAAKENRVEWPVHGDTSMRELTDGSLQVTFKERNGLFTASAVLAAGNWKRLS